MGEEIFKLKLQKIIDLIDITITDFNDSNESKNNPYSLVCRAISFSIYQICEHLIKYESEIKKFKNNIPWKNIHNTRVFLAHVYDKVNTTLLFQIVTDDFPLLRNEIVNVIEQLK